MQYDGQYGPAKSIQYEEGERVDEHKEILVVSASNAIIDPGAMMVKPLQGNMASP